VPPYSTYGVRVPAYCVPYVPVAQGSSPRGPTHSMYEPEVPYVPCHHSGVALASHLARIRALDPSLPLATASNIDLRGTALEAHVAPYTIVPLARNASL